MSQATTTEGRPIAAAPRIAPPSLVGPWGWLKANLFSSWWSTALTLLLGYVILRLAVSFIDWAFVHAIWSVPYTPQGTANTAVCQNAKGEGACWAIIADKYRLILFGRFPYDEQWRPALVVLLFVGLYIASAFRGFWGKGTQSPVVR